MKGIEDNTLIINQGTYADFAATLKYKERVVTEKGDLSKSERLEARATTFSILGVGVVFKTQEGALILQNRANVMQGAGTYSVPSGGYMQSKDASGAFQPLTPVSPFRAAYDQLRDEQNLTSPNGLHYVGISGDRAFAENPTLIFTGTSNITMGQVYEKFLGAKDKFETNFLRFIAGDAEGLLKNLAGEYTDLRTNQRFNDAQVMGTGLGALMLYGQIVHGQEWFQEACKQVRSNNIVEVSIDNRVQ